MPTPPAYPGPSRVLHPAEGHPLPRPLFCRQSAPETEHRRGQLALLEREPNPPRLEQVPLLPRAGARGWSAVVQDIVQGEEPGRTAGPAPLPEKSEMGRGMPRPAHFISHSLLAAGPERRRLPPLLGRLTGPVEVHVVVHPPHPAHR